MNIDTKPSYGLQRRADQIPVNLRRLAALPDETLSGLARGFQDAVNQVLGEAGAKGLLVKDCDIRWVNVQDSELNPDRTRGRYLLSFLASKPPTP